MWDKKTISKEWAFLSIFVFPIYSLYISVRYYRKPEAKDLFWAFCVFLGLIHIVFSIDGSEYDGTRYAQALFNIYNNNISLSDFLSTMFISGGSVDVYQPLVTYIVSLFTDNYRWLFGVYAIVFGFFYSRNMWYILGKLPERNSFFIWILIILLFLICPIWQINGVRMWTALHVFVYGALPYLLDGNKKRLPWCFFSLLVHFSYFTPLLILLFFVILKKTLIKAKAPLLCLFVFSFFMESLDVELVRLYISYLPDFVYSKLIYYTGDKYMEIIASSKQSFALHVRLSQLILKFFYFVLLLYIGLEKNTNSKVNSIFYAELYSFTLLIYSVSNILSLLPSGGRFITVSQMFAMPMIILFFAYADLRGLMMRTLKIIIPFILLLPILFSIRVGFDFYGVSLLMSPIFSVFFEDNIPLINFLK